MESFKVLLVGGGEIQFGSPEGNWNHTKRLEQILGARLEILGIIDPDCDRVQFQIDLKRDKGIQGYANTKIYKSVQDAADIHDIPFDLVIIGVPPHFRGSSQSSADLDLQLLRAFKNTKRWLVEKPVAAVQPTAEAGLEKVAAAYSTCGAIVGVGYMFAAFQAVQKIKQIIAKNHLHVMSTSARYYMAYEYARKPSWWNKDISCGPVVEQATHLLQLSLTYGGPVDFRSIQAQTVDHNTTAGKLSKLGLDEEGLIPSEARVPRITNAIWKYNTGATGSLTHAIALHGTDYSVEFEVLCDGYYFKISGFYDGMPTLQMRCAGGPLETFQYPEDDPYKTQLQAVIDGKPTCTYEQALETYKLSWAIRLAGERGVEGVR